MKYKMLRKTATAPSYLPADAWIENVINGLVFVKGRWQPERTHVLFVGDLGEYYGVGNDFDKYYVAPEPRPKKWAVEKTLNMLAKQEVRAISQVNQSLIKKHSLQSARGRTSSANV